MTTLRAELWLADCGETVSPAWEGSQLALLSESERHRYQAFLRPERRRQFLVGRILLRHALSEMFGGTPAMWRLCERLGGAPSLESATPHPVAFSLSHSRDQVACLLAVGARVGVDIEYAGRQRDCVRMAAHVFHPENARQLQSLGAEERITEFYRFWTLYEAASKACNGCTRARDAHARRSTSEPRLACGAAELGTYRLALAICGDVRPPKSLRRFHAPGTIAMQESVTWDHPGAECADRERLRALVLTPCSGTYAAV